MNPTREYRKISELVVRIATCACNAVQNYALGIHELQTMEHLADYIRYIITERPYESHIYSIFKYNQSVFNLSP